MVNYTLVPFSPYVFHQLNRTMTGNWELLAIKLALEEWRHWLEGTEHPIFIWIDQRNLAYIKCLELSICETLYSKKLKELGSKQKGATNRLNANQAKWSLFFARI